VLMGVDNEVALTVLLVHTSPLERSVESLYCAATADR